MSEKSLSVSSDQSRTEMTEREPFTVTAARNFRHLRVFDIFDM